MTTKEKVLAFIEECDHSPTVREIAKAVGKSHTTVHNHLNNLEKDGRIRMIGEQRRIYPARSVA